MKEKARSKKAEAASLDPDPSLQLADELYQYLDEKKAENLILMDLSQVNSYFGYFLIATAASGLHLRTMMREIRKVFGARIPQKGSRTPDDADSGWIIVDFVDVVVHVFLRDQRKFYNLERLWGDATIIRSSESDE